MAVAHSTITVGTSATSLTAAVADRLPTANGVARSALVQNQSATDAIYVGGPGVTTTDFGVKIPAGADLSLDLGYGEELFAVAAAPVNVNVLHTGV